MNLVDGLLSSYKECELFGSTIFWWPTKEMYILGQLLSDPQMKCTFWDSYSLFFRLFSPEHLFLNMFYLANASNDCVQLGKLFNFEPRIIYCTSWGYKFTEPQRNWLVIVQKCRYLKRIGSFS